MMDGFVSLERRKTPLSLSEFSHVFEKLVKKKEKYVYGPSLWIHLYITTAYHNQIDYFKQYSDILLLSGYDVNVLSYRYGINVFHICVLDFLYNTQSEFPKQVLEYLLVSGTHVFDPCLLCNKNGQVELFDIIRLSSSTCNCTDSIFARLSFHRDQWGKEPIPTSTAIIQIIADIFRHQTDVILHTIHSVNDVFMKRLCISFLCMVYKLNPLEKTQDIINNAKWLQSCDKEVLHNMSSDISQERKRLYFPQDVHFMHPSMCDDGNICLPYEYVCVRFDKKIKWVYHRSTIPYMLRVGYFPMPHYRIDADTKKKILHAYREFPYCFSEIQDFDHIEMTKNNVVADMITSIMSSFYPYTVVRSLFNAPLFVIKYTCKKLQEKPTYFKTFGRVKDKDSFSDECFKHMKSLINMDRMNYVMENVILDYNLFNKILNYNPYAFEKTLTGLYNDIPFVYDIVMERIRTSHQENMSTRGDYEVYAWDSIQLLYKCFRKETSIV